MKLCYNIIFFGNIKACRTEAEIELEDEWLMSLFETKTGWEKEIANDDIELIHGLELQQTIQKAKEGLMLFVNRMGTNPPPGLTKVELSHWLMEKVNPKT